MSIFKSFVFISILTLIVSCSQPSTYDYEEPNDDFNYSFTFLEIKSKIYLGDESTAKLVRDVAIQQGATSYIIYEATFNEDLKSINRQDHNAADSIIQLYSLLTGFNYNENKYSGIHLTNSDYSYMWSLQGLGLDNNGKLIYVFTAGNYDKEQFDVWYSYNKGHLEKR